MFPRIYIFFSAFKGGEKKEEEEHFLEINNRDSAKIFKRRSKNIQDLAVNHWHLLRRLQETMKVLTYESVSCLYLPLVSFHHAEAVLPALSGLWQQSNSPFLSLPNSSGQRPHQQQPGGSFVLFFVFFSFIFISWSLITLQYCGGFCHTLTWISHGLTCVPHPDPPSRLPPHPIPLGLPSAPALSNYGS